jgi:hypothetical protein
MLDIKSILIPRQFQRCIGIEFSLHLYNMAQMSGHRHGVSVCPAASRVWNHDRAAREDRDVSQGYWRQRLR